MKPLTLPDQLPFRHLLQLSLFFAIAAIVMAMIPLQDPSEGRYAVVAQNMVLSGDWITPITIEDGVPTPFLGKPPLQFWLVATSIALVGHNEIAARLPSLLATALSLFVMYRFAAVLLSPTIGLIAMLIQISSLIGFFFAGACMTDPVLAAAVVTCVLGLPLSLGLRDLNRRQEAVNWEYGVFIALSAGLLCKGPIALVLVIGSLLPWIIAKRPWTSLKEVQWIRGLAITAALTTPWYLLAELRQPGFLNYFIIHENILRFLVKKYGDLYGSGHRHFRGMIWFMTMLASMPWLIIGLLVAFRSSARTSHQTILSPRRWLTLTASLPTPLLIPVGLAFFPALFFSLSRQVSIYYTLPSIPALSLLLSAAIVAHWTEGDVFFSRITSGIRFLAVTTLIGLVAYSFSKRADLFVLSLAALVVGLFAAIEWCVKKCPYPSPQSRSVFLIAGYLVITYFAGALFQLTDYVGGGSCRDLIDELRRITPAQNITFYEKIPHSALFYARADTKAPLQFVRTEKIPQSITSPFVIRKKAYRKLEKQLLNAPLELAARKNILEGGWIVFTKKVP